MQRAYPRTDRVYLDPDEPRCEPQTYCGMKAHCARYLADLPQQNASLGDFSILPNIVCPQYVPAARCTRPEPQKQPVKRHWSDHEQ